LLLPPERTLSLITARMRNEYWLNLGSYFGGSMLVSYQPFVWTTKRHFLHEELEDYNYAYYEIPFEGASNEMFVNIQHPLSRRIFRRMFETRLFERGIKLAVLRKKFSMLRFRPIVEPAFDNFTGLRRGSAVDRI